MSSRFPRIRTAVGALALATAGVIGLTLTGCAATGGGASPTPAVNTDYPVDDAARALLPDDILNGGKLEAAIPQQWPPFAYKKDGKPVGLDVDMATAVAGTLGLQLNITDIKFSSMIPSIVNGRFDIAMNELEDSAERRKEVQLVIYYKAGLSLLVKKGTTGVDPESLCGLTLAVTRGSTAVTYVEKAQPECESSGKGGIKTEVFPDSAASILAVQSGKAEAMMIGNASGIYLTETTAGDLEVLDGTLPGTTADVGIVLNKKEDQLAEAIQAALKALKKSGKYASILDTYGVSQNAVDDFTIARDK